MNEFKEKLKALLVSIVNIEVQSSSLEKLSQQLSELEQTKSGSNGESKTDQPDLSIQQSLQEEKELSIALQVIKKLLQVIQELKGGNS